MTLNKRGARFWDIGIADKDLLLSIKKIIQAEHKISIREGKNNEKTLYRLQIGSKEMFNDLLTLGFTQDKTKSLAVPKVPAKYFRDFVRGYFDGDGHVWTGYIHKDRLKSTYTILTGFTSCSHAFLLELRRRLRLFLIFKGVLRKDKKKNFYRLIYSVKDSMKLHDFMYNHPHLVSGEDLFLQRKKVVFDKYLTMRP